MRLVMLGPPGVGKGTQATLIAHEFDIQHYSTGDIFREILKGSSNLSRELAKYLDAGNLVPDDIVFETIRKTLSEDGAGVNGWVLDGFPRNRKQAEMLDGLLLNENCKLDSAIYLAATRDVLVDRLSSRKVCSNCGAVYNLQMNRPKNNDICDKCGGKLIQRKDDEKETILKRIFIFESEFASLRQYYKDRGILLEVNGNGDTNDVFKQIREGLKSGQERGN